ncbi:7-cyano-7-deazaguanine synthase, partial [Candidatus Peregrinibacteria bacterium]|nr:7-cyano-7-deazaguanine synthase [Candidatus Peregrinibacteria bacterium]
MFISKVRKSLAQIPSFTKIIVAVSGGPDSVALAYMLKKLGYKIVIAHLNHGLRGAESDADEKFVRDLAKKWKVPCVVQKSDIPKTGNLENNARQIRY